MTQSPVPRPRFGEDWLIAVLDCLVEGVVALDQEGVVIAANPAAERLLGFDLATRRYAGWHSLRWATLVDEAGAPFTEEQHPIARALRSREGGAPAVVGLPTNGGTCWLQLTTHVLAASGGPAPDGIVVSFQDVTARVTAEHGRQRLLGLQREMMAAASHDLRNPLAVISGTVALMREDRADRDDRGRREAVATIDRQVGRLERLVDDLALIARLEGGGLVADPRPVPVTELVEAALDGLTASPDIEVAVDGALAVSVDTDHGRRMLLNLVDNACKYGDPPVRVDAEAVARGVAISVRDHGAGVPREFVGQLFDRFTRADPHAGAGMGLGLAIVDRLARLNHGSVSYQDGPRGATFRLVLPPAEPTDA